MESTPLMCIVMLALLIRAFLHVIDVVGASRVNKSFNVTLSGAGSTWGLYWPVPEGCWGSDSIVAVHSSGFFM